MRNPVLLPVLVALCVYASPCLAAPQVSQDNGPTVDETNIGRDEAQQRISELLATSEGDETERSQLVELYRQLVNRLDSEKSFVERAETFRKAIDVAPTEAAALRSELAQKQEAPASAVDEVATSSAEAQLRLTQLQAEVATLRGQLAETEGRIAEEEARATQQLQEEVREVLAQVEARLAQAAPLGGDPTERARVERALLRSSQRAKTAELAMLEQEELSRPARLDLLRARRDLMAWNLAFEVERADWLENKISELRQAEAERARLEAERLRDEALDKHRLIKETAIDLEKAALETEKLLPKIATVRGSRRKIEERLAEVSADLDQTLRLFELKITKALGAMLLDQRRDLPSARSFRKDRADREDDIDKERLRLFQLERLLKEPMGESAADRLLEQLTDYEAAQLSAQGRIDLRADLTELLAKKHESLLTLQRTVRDYLAAIDELERQEKALLAKADELAAVLNKELLWIPDARPFDSATVQRLPLDVAWLASPTLLSQAVSAIYADLERFRGLHAFVALVAAGLLVARRRIRTILEALASRVGKVLTDGISLTLRAFALQILGALPVPGLIAWLGWRSMVAEGSTDITKAVGSGLVASSTLFFVVRLLCRFFEPAGIARAHFRWTERTGQRVRKTLTTYLVVALPATFVIVLTQAQEDHLIRHSLGRTAFIVLMLATAVLAFSLLHSTRGLFVGKMVVRASTWLRRSRPLWLPLGILVPLTLAAMAAMGYYYAALQLNDRLNQTLFVIIATIFLHAFLMRWLVVSQRRLALKIAREKRAAQAKKGEAGGDEETIAENVIETFEEIDVVEIKDQTQDLLRISLTLAFVVALWFAWVDVLPALGILDRVPLWSHEVVVDGVKESLPITLADLGLALVMILVTITAAQNMPGFLEIALLQRLRLEPGVRYATRTLVLYAIVTVGIILTFNSIGVGWSSVQWLVAALTVGLGFGLQEIFANFVSGLIILLERPVRVGDTVTVGDVSGVVSRIRMRATTITDWSRRELLVPNKNFITGELINWSLSDPILRIEFPIGIAYGSDTSLAHKTMLQVCHDHPMVLDQPEPNVFFIGFGDNSLNFEARIFVNEPTNTARSRIVHDLHMAVDRACREHGITIAFPQRDLHFKSSEAVLRVALEKTESRPGRDARSSEDDVQDTET